MGGPGHLYDMGGLETKLERKRRAGIQSIMTLPDAPVTATAAPLTAENAALFGFENTYARLPEHFYARVNPTPVATPRLVKVNVELARDLGLDPDALASAEGVAILAGNLVAVGSEPIAMAYAGHQFG
ncbi:MAG: serine/tyrosine/threonine adenylyltransferase, partial [Acidobacteriaceae bacterium]|nr:serine/tyrosine/threonine adenylyltransferase [Acidobacteriaceae bacterium]